MDEHILGLRSEILPSQSTSSQIQRTVPIILSHADRFVYGIAYVPESCDIECFGELWVCKNGHETSEHRLIK